ncbi:hypothetical protein GQ42DRAFT_162243 [Ramicandelaber brevisporus]|nr:hypothetical protein GQ42DRAFT_162243 [Ramicandelaber brevisporus]
MLIPTANRRLIYETLFKDGVLVAKKDFNASKHNEIPVPNLEVIKAMQSLTSKGFVKTQFSWQYYYYTLTKEGVAYLRDYLHLPEEIIPNTHKRQVRPAGVAGAEGAQEGGRQRFDRPQRGEYRRRDDKEGASGSFRPEFRGGYGRGAGAAQPAQA